MNLYLFFENKKLFISTFHKIWLITRTLNWNANFHRRTSVFTSFIAFVFIHFFQDHGCNFFISIFHSNIVRRNGSKFLESWFVLQRAFTNYVNIQGWVLETIQDFLIRLDIKPLMLLLKISIFSLNNVILRLTKIRNSAEKNWANFQEIKYFKNQSFQKISLIKVGLLIKYSSQKKKFGKIRLI